jgi:hypothetical protein
MKRDFDAEIAELEARLTLERDVAVSRLRAIHEAWARALLGIDDTGSLVTRVRAAVERGVDPRLAAKATGQLRAAENHQWEIGTWATGAGEGLSSMRAVRELQIAQAWLWAAQCPEESCARDQALELLEQAAADPNRVAAAYDRDIRALRERLRE